MKSGADLPGCLNNACADHLDFDSYRKEKDGPNLGYTNIMETSVGSPDTWRGVCLARPGVAANTETGGTYYDLCKSQNTLTVYYLDGIQDGADEIEYKDFECPNHYACSLLGNHNDYCRYSCTANSHCASGYYCTGEHCCATGSDWSSVLGICNPHDPCTMTCTLTNFWTDPDCWFSTPLPYEKACCNVGSSYGVSAWYAYSDIIKY